MGYGADPSRWPAPGRAQIARAVPAGSRRARSQRDFLAALAADPDLAELRADCARNVLECARVWARYADWADQTTRPTRARVCAQVGGRGRGGQLGLSTFKKCRAWLESRGYLGTVVAGSTAALDGMRTSPALVDEQAPNTAAVYVLAVPRRKQLIRRPACSDPLNRPPSGLRKEPVQGHARETPGQRQNRAGCARAVLLAAGRARCATAGQGITKGWAAHLAGPFAAAGWTPGDVAHAVDYEPGGAQHRLSARVAHVVGWLRWRLARWLGADGAPLPSASQQRAAARAAAAAERARLREHLAAIRRDRVDPAPHAAAIRAALGWRSDMMSRMQQRSQRTESTSDDPPLPAPA
jgi:hypothetical protein